MTATATQSTKAVETLVMDDAKVATLTEAGYKLPENWPHPALAVLDMNGDTGWEIGYSGDDRAYIAPDGTAFLRGAFLGSGRIPLLVGLSRKGSPVPLVLPAGAEHPAWLPKAKRARSSGGTRTKVEGASNGRTLALSDDELRALVEEEVKADPSIPLCRVVQNIRAAGLSVSGGRVRVVYATLPHQPREKAAKAPKAVKAAKKAKGTTAAKAAKPVAKSATTKATKKAEAKGRAMTRPAPKPSSKKARAK